MLTGIQGSDDGLTIRVKVHVKTFAKPSGREGEAYTKLEQVYIFRIFGNISVLSTNVPRTTVLETTQSVPSTSGVPVFVGLSGLLAVLAVFAVVFIFLGCRRNTNLINEDLKNQVASASQEQLNPGECCYFNWFEHRQ